MTSESIKKAVLSLWERGVSYSEIGTRYCLSKGQVAGIVHRYARGTKNGDKRRHVRIDKIPASYFRRGETLTSISLATGIPRTTLADWRLGR